MFTKKPYQIELNKKIKELGVENIDTNYIDSVVIFKKSKHRVIYDYAMTPGESELLGQKLGLTNLEKPESRLFIGTK